jgi:outer membrane protein assembly complex protein YaeT
VIALAAVALTVALAGPAAAQSGAKEMVAEVTIAGNRSVSAEKAMRYIQTRPGFEYSAKRAHEDVARLAGTHLFKHIAVRTRPTSDGRIIVTFDVQEHPSLVREVVFKHAKHATDEELSNLTRVHKGMPLDKTLNQLACYEIQDFYKKKGRYFASVTLEEGYEEFHDRVVFNITEGPIVRVRSVNFVGQDELATAGRLRTQTDTSRAILGTIGGTYQPAMVDSDVTKLEEYYRNNGFLNVRVSREVKFSEDFQYVDVTFHIHEGVRHRVKDIIIDGTKAFPSEQISTIVMAKKGEYYNENVISADVKNITDYGGWRGFPLNVHKTVTTVPGEEGVVRVQYQVEDRPPALVSRVLIVGNTVTKDNVIRRMIPLQPGQTLRFPELRLAERDLARLGIFEMNPELGVRPTVQALPPEPGSQYQDVLVSVKETHTGSFMIGAGVNSDNGLVGSIVLNEKNFDIFRFPTSWADVVEGRAFRGAGQEFRIEAVPGNQLQRYSVTWRDPYLFDLPYSLTTSGYYYDRYFNEYLESRLGGRLTVGHQFTKAISGNVGMRLENVDVRDVASFAPLDYLSVQGNNAVYAPRIGATYDTRDSYLRPTEGGILDASYEQVFGSFTFPIFNVEGSRFFTVTQRNDGSGKHVIALRSQVAFAGDNAPVFERFFAGGFRSLRGFQFRGVGPNENGYMLGGTFMFLNSIEYQVPILASDNLYFVTFLDSGTVESKIDLRDYRVSAGFGFRISVPALGPVPLALDFGFPINRRDSDQTQVFNFWFGMYR